MTHGLSGYSRSCHLKSLDLHVLSRFLMKSGDPEGTGYGVGFVAVSPPDPLHSALLLINEYTPPLPPARMP